jgi:hypothetical protein
MPKVYMGCDMMKHWIIGSSFFQEATMSSHLHSDMLKHYPVPQLNCDTWFQKDGVPPHFGNTVHLFLNEHFPSRGTERDRFLTWPPKCPDLTPLYFFLWSYVKNIFYQKETEDVLSVQQYMRLNIL